MTNTNIIILKAYGNAGRLFSYTEKVFLVPPIAPGGGAKF